MKVYIAARYVRRQEMVEKAAQLMQYGIPVTSRWIGGVHEEDEAPEDVIARFAKEDLDDIARADVLVAFAEEPYTQSRGGRHVELGYALALGHTILVVGGRENIFSYLPEIVHAPDWDAALSWLYDQNVMPEELKKELGL